jgi:hypothetical protein
MILNETQEYSIFIKGLLNNKIDLKGLEYKLNFRKRICY